MPDRTLPCLPIDALIPDVVGALREHGAVVVQAAPGAGKSTRIPPAVLDAGLCGGKKVVMLVPRRVAARATARRVAQERGVKLGEEVGYQVRFDDCTTRHTQLVIMTEGILARRLHQDPFLEDVGVVILDEFHERSIHTDLALAFLRELRQVREDLKVVVMSATIEAEPIATFLECPALSSEGRMFPVEISYVDKPLESRDELNKEIGRIIAGIAGDTKDDGGNILVFLPGVREIHACMEYLNSRIDAEFADVFPLYSALSPEAQDRALESSERRKIILSTNIAETSLTIDGVTVVIDSGQVKQLRMSPDSGLDELVLQSVSLASAAQRTGRAGRLGPGRAWRLWTRAYEMRMAEFDVPEISRVDITSAVLEVLAWSASDPAQFAWFEAPQEYVLTRTVALLRQLGALEHDGHRLSDIGRKLLAIPVHPRLGRMLIEAHRNKCVNIALDIAALLSEQDFVLRVPEGALVTDSDVVLRAELLRDCLHNHGTMARQSGINVHKGRAQRVWKVRQQLDSVLRRSLQSVPDDRVERPAKHSHENILKILITAYPDRICMRRDDGGRRYVMTGGHSVALAKESSLHEVPLIIAPHIAGSAYVSDADGRRSQRGLIRMASKVEESWLHELYPERFHARVELEFDEERGRVMAWQSECFDELCLRKTNVSPDDVGEQEHIAQLLAEHAAGHLTKAFGLDQHAVQWLTRVECLRDWMPELNLPDIPGITGEEQSAEARKILAQICWGRRSFDDLRRVNFVESLKGYLNYEQISAIEKHAPDQMDVPSGSRVRLQYEHGKPPVLAVRLQELFGMRTTPRVAGGSIPVLIHLLAPNYRPVQVTQDLESFWNTTYPEVRKELRARYSKHAWPDDPWSARAQRK